MQKIIDEIEALGTDKSVDDGANTSEEED